MLETLYKDFTEKLLPKIQEGLVITKDYFTDLFGRYVKFLLITDILTLVLCLLAIIFGQWFFRKAYKWQEENEYDVIPTFTCIFLVIIVVLGIIFGIEAVGNITKDIYIPEIRVMEKLNIIKSPGE